MQVTCPLELATHYPRSFAHHKGLLGAQRCLVTAIGMSAGGGPLPSHSNLYVRGFPPSYTDSEILGLFSPFGSISSVRVVAATEGQAPHAFVKFETAEQVRADRGGRRAVWGSPGTLLAWKGFGSRGQAALSRGPRPLLGPHSSWKTRPWASGGRQTASSAADPVRAVRTSAAGCWRRRDYTRAYALSNRGAVPPLGVGRVFC